MEVKTYILRLLPVLVYNPQTSIVSEGSQQDPTITSIYFDNKHFSLYTKKIDKPSQASSLRLRWFGHLRDSPEILLEKKTVREGDDSSEIRFPIKEKYIQPFVAGGTSFPGFPSFPCLSKHLLGDVKRDEGVICSQEILSRSTLTRQWKH